MRSDSSLRLTLFSWLVLRDVQTETAFHTVTVSHSLLFAAVDLNFKRACFRSLATRGI